jgi:hypothetical protein
MYDFVYLSVRRSVRDSHWSKDYRDGIGIRVFYENPGFYNKAFHHFGFAAMCWAMWKCRNMIVFDKKVIKHPAEIVLHACALLSYWAGAWRVK